MDDPEYLYKPNPVGVSFDQTVSGRGVDDNYFEHLLGHEESNIHNFGPEGTKKKVVFGADWLHEATYQVHEEIGDGGTAIVYRACDLKTGKEWAARKLKGPRVDESIIGRDMIDEARLAAKIPEHPNVAQIHDVGMNLEHEAYMLMEYLPGGSLQEKIEHRRIGDVRTALEVLHDVASGLQHLHDNNLVHGEMSPQQVMFDKYGVAKLIDLVVYPLSAEGKTTIRWHKEDYGFPEPENEVTVRSDICLFGQLAGMVIGVAESGTDVSEMVDGGRFIVRPTLIAGGNANEKKKNEVVGVLEQMLKRDPKDRPSSVMEAYKMLEKVLVVGLEDKPRSLTERVMGENSI